jgi:hypothetical protein
VKKSIKGTKEDVTIRKLRHFAIPVSLLCFSACSLFLPPAVTAAGPKLPADTGFYGNSVNWDNVTGCALMKLVFLGLEKSLPARGKLPLAKSSKLGGKGLWIL